MFNFSIYLPLLVYLHGATFSIAAFAILVSTFTSIALAIRVFRYSRNWDGSTHLDSNARKVMQVQTVRLNLQYDLDDLKQILIYFKVHDHKRRGRYDSRVASRIGIWTHAFSNNGCKRESCLMFRLEFDLIGSALLSVAMMPGFDWEAFLDELAMLEKAAIGNSIYGKARREPTK